MKTVKQEKTKRWLIRFSHDKLFKAIFQILEVAMDCVKYFLPREVVESIDFSNFKLDNTHYISDKLKETVSDVVYRTSQKGSNGKVALALLWEHKSYPDPNICYQLHSYINGIWQKDMAQGQDKTGVISIVFYHGKTKWEKRKLSDDFPDLSPELKKSIPDFEYYLISIHDIPDALIASLKHKLLGALLLMFKKIDEAEFLEKNTEELFEYFANKPETTQIWRKFVTYFVVNAKLPAPKMLKTIKTILPPHIQSTAMTAYQSILEAGEAKGEARGIKEGEARGIKEGEARGKAEECKKNIKRMLLSGDISVPKIADIMEVSVSFVTEMRDALLRDGKTLNALVRDFNL